MANAALRFLQNVSTGNFLDGQTQSGGVQVVAGVMTFSSGDCNFTGTGWVLATLPDGTVSVQCQGNVPGNTYLDGNTGNGGVGLAPNTAGDFSGTHWSFRPSGSGYLLYCNGTGSGDYRYLQSTGGSVQLATSPGAPGIVWTLSQMASATPPA